MLFNHRLVKVIYPILLTSTYHVNPECDLKLNSALNKHFHMYFAESFAIKISDLDFILSLFNFKNNLEAVIALLPNAQGEFAVDITIWLLRYIVTLCCSIWTNSFLDGMF